MGEPITRPAYLRYILFSLLFAGLIFLTLVFLNITLRRKIRSKTSELQDLVNQLRLSEGKYRDLADSLPQVVFETDETGNILYVNQNAFDLFKYTKEEFDKGINISQIIIPEDHDRAIEDMQNVLNGIRLGGTEYTL